MKKFLAALSAVLVAAVPAWACTNSVFTGGATHTYYASTSGSDAGNTCDNVSYPCTLTFALSMAAGVSYIQSQSTDIELANGTYTGGIAFAGAAWGLTNVAGSGFVGIHGTGGHANVTITDSGTSGDAATILAMENAKLVLCDVTIKSTHGSDVFATIYGEIGLDNNVYLGQASGPNSNLLHAEQHGVVNIPYGFTIDATGVAGNIANAALGVRLDGVMVFNEAAQTVTLTATPVFNYFADVEEAGILYVNADFVTFTGAGTGPRYFVNSGGVINTNDGTATYLPGNSAGYIYNTGLYFPQAYPSFSGATNLGTGGTATIGSTLEADRAFTLALNSGSSGTGSSGAVTVAFGSVVSLPTCAQPSLQNGTGTWAAGASSSISGISTTGFTFNWNNNGSNLTASKVYNAQFLCGNR